MTNQEYTEIMDKSNFLIDSANPYDMEIKKALEKQIPQESFRISEIDSNDNAFVYCPICKAGNETAINAIKHIYCWKCGQALKWE